MIEGVKWRNREMEKKYTDYDRRCEMEKQRDLLIEICTDRETWIDGQARGKERQREVDKKRCVRIVLWEWC
jgi:hypothetical protein